VCAIAIADGVPNFDRAGLRWRSHQKVHLRLFKRHKPNKLRIRMYRRLDDHGYVTGKSRRAAYNLRRVTLDGRRIWIAGFFARPRQARHLYLDVHVRLSGRRGLWRNAVDVARLPPPSQEQSISVDLPPRPPVEVGSTMRS
jgi:hypothetical protein